MVRWMQKQDFAIAYAVTIPVPVLASSTLRQEVTAVQRRLAGDGANLGDPAVEQVGDPQAITLNAMDRLGLDIPRMSGARIFPGFDPKYGSLPEVARTTPHPYQPVRDYTTQPVLQRTALASVNTRYVYFESREPSPDLYNRLQLMEFKIAKRATADNQLSRENHTIIVMDNTTPGSDEAISAEFAKIVYKTLHKFHKHIAKTDLFIMLAIAKDLPGEPGHATGLYIPRPGSMLSTERAVFFEPNYGIFCIPNSNADRRLRQTANFLKVWFQENALPNKYFALSIAARR
ncbi:MAG: hypothetical protein A3J38_01865 [Gammaproteobacteria bacterium RIFCSPHIGHO2_12_FULL_45_9]|nr:MAG: hypothetical protein A3J38_01865 [Gammaproteobacteria bacterium RIFCSPHIGHO2_12_FULL_45_9]